MAKYAMDILGPHIHWSKEITALRHRKNMELPGGKKKWVVLVEKYQK